MIIYYSGTFRVRSVFMDIFKNRNFVRLFFAALASQMGTTVGNMAFAFYLLDHFSNQPAYTTLAELMYSLPTVFVFLIVGVAADRLDRKKVAENCDWIRAGLTIILFAALYTGSILSCSVFCSSEAP